MSFISLDSTENTLKLDYLPMPTPCLKSEAPELRLDSWHCFIKYKYITGSRKTDFGPTSISLQTGFGKWHLNCCSTDHKLLVVSDGSHMKVVFLVRVEVFFVWEVYHEPHICIATANTCTKWR